MFVLFYLIGEFLPFCSFKVVQETVMDVIIISKFLGTVIVFHNKPRKHPNMRTNKAISEIY